MDGDEPMPDFSPNSLEYIRFFETLSIRDVAIVGGKNASLGEMLSTLKEKGVRVPNGFATTARAYLDFLKANHLEERIKKELQTLRKNPHALEKVAKRIRSAIENSKNKSARLIARSVARSTAPLWMSLCAAAPQRRISPPQALQGSKRRF